jgi:hypothetical protein
MAVVNPTSPTFSTVDTAQVLATGANGTVRTLDLKTAVGAWLYGRIGRRGATALTRAGYYMIRSTQNATIVHPNSNRDMVSSIGTAISNTVASGGASASNTVTLTSATSFAVGDTICLHSDDTSANRVEFSRVVSISSNTLTVEENFVVSHNAADRVTTQGDCFAIWLSGGDSYTIRAVNNSGQSLVFEMYAATYASDTIT